MLKKGWSLHRVLQWGITTTTSARRCQSLKKYYLAPKARQRVHLFIVHGGTYGSMISTGADCFSKRNKHQSFTERWLVMNRELFNLLQFFVPVGTSSRLLACVKGKLLVSIHPYTPFPLWIFFCTVSHSETTINYSIFVHMPLIMYISYITRCVSKLVLISRICSIYHMLCFKTYAIVPYLTYLFHIVS